MKATAAFGGPMALGTTERMRLVHQYALDEGFASGFPNFHQASYGNGPVGGIQLLGPSVAEAQLVPRQLLGPGSTVSVPATFRAVDTFASQNGFSGALPNGFVGPGNTGPVVGTVFLKAATSTRRDVPRTLLGNPNMSNVPEMLRAAAGYAERNGFAAGFPTFHTRRVNGLETCTLVLLLKGTSEWRDVAIDDLQPPRIENTCVILCRFRDASGNLTPVLEAPEFYRQYFFEAGTSGLRDFYRQVANTRVRVAGEVFGWLDIGHTLAEHGALGGQAQRSQAYEWGIAAARANNIPVDEFPRRVVIVNQASDHGAVQTGVSMLISHGGGADLNHSFMQHEFGHVLGLGHARATNPEEEYGDDYCIMAVFTTPFESSRTILGVTSIAGPGLNCVYANNMGGLPLRRILEVPPTGVPQLVRLTPMGYPERNEKAVARIPAAGARVNTNWLELRHPSRWDAAIGAPTVTLHETHPGDGHSYLVRGPHAKGLRFPADALYASDRTFVLRLEGLESDGHSALVSVWYEGTLLREPTGEIYVLYGAARFHVPSMTEFGAMGYQASQVHQLSAGGAAWISTEPVDGALLREASGAIYVVYGTAKFHIPNMTEFNALGFQLAHVRELWQGALGHLGTTPQDGTLMREHDKPEVYLISGGQKRHVPNAQRLVELGGWEDVRVIYSNGLAHLPTGPNA